MSNSLAIAAVTATLRNLLVAGVTMMPELADTTVTTQLPDRARASTNTGNQINLFLYQAAPNAAWRNLDMPRQVRPGETAAPPLALNLYYLLTAFGRDNDAVRPFSHELLGRAMSVLHDHPLLGADEIRTALSGNDLFQQIERIRFSLQPLSVEEIYRLWTGFQTPYRTSVAYEASVVLIDSTREVSAPLPVLTRGLNDVGVFVQPGIGAPAIESIDPAFDVTFGDTLTISGAQLGGDAVVVSFATPRLDAPVVVPAVPVDGKFPATTVTVQVPQGPALPAGWYAVSVTVTRGTFTQTSNELAVALGPQVTAGLPGKQKAVNGAVQVTLGCAPPILDGQRVALLLDGRVIAPVAAPRPASSVTFDVTGVSAGATFVARLRVDGADSPVLELDPKTGRKKAPPAFDPLRTIAIT